MLGGACNLATGAQWCENSYFKGWGHDCVNMIETKKQNKVLSKGELSSCHNHLWLKCQFVPQGITLILNTNFHIASSCKLHDQYKHRVILSWLFVMYQEHNTYCLLFELCHHHSPLSLCAYCCSTFYKVSFVAYLYDKAKTLLPRIKPWWKHRWWVPWEILCTRLRITSKVLGMLNKIMFHCPVQELRLGM